MLINILWPPRDANQYGGSSWQTGSIFSCCKGLWDVFLPKPITTKHQTVFWLVSQSRRMSAIFVGSCRWISFAAACADPVVHSTWPLVHLITLAQVDATDRFLLGCVVRRSNQPHLRCPAQRPVHRTPSRKSSHNLRLVSPVKLVTRRP